LQTISGNFNAGGGQITGGLGIQVSVDADMIGNAHRRFERPD
jgi:hypothetical protein